MYSRFLMIFFGSITYFFSASAQNNFDSGFYLDNDGTSHECLIFKNRSFSSRIIVKNGDVLDTLSVEDVKEFQIFGFAKYRRMEGEEASLKEKSFFVRVLVTGRANLYESSSGRFFFSVDDGEIMELDYRKFKNEENQIVQKFFFRQQLYAELNCDDLEKKYFEEIGYNRSSLMELFVKSNQCNGDQRGEHLYKTGNFNDDTQLKMFAGIGFGQAKLDEGVYSFSDGKLAGANFLAGIEYGYFFNPKWVLVTSFYFQRCVSSNDFNFGSMKLNYNSLNLGVGLNFMVFEKSDIEILAGPAYQIGYLPYIEAELGDALDTKNYNRLTSGLMLNATVAKGRASLDFRYDIGQSFNDTSEFEIDGKLSSQNIVLGYKIY